MSRAKNQKGLDAGALGPLPENPQMGARVYRALLDSILTGQIESGTPLRPDLVARQLEVPRPCGRLCTDSKATASL
jgi:hypothetical protein